MENRFEFPSFSRLRTIRWPSGEEQVVEGLKADHLHVITESQ